MNKLSKKDITNYIQSKKETEKYKKKIYKRTVEVINIIFDFYKIKRPDSVWFLDAPEGGIGSPNLDNNYIEYGYILPCKNPYNCTSENCSFSKSFLFLDKKDIIKELKLTEDFNPKPKD